MFEKVNCKDSESKISCKAIAKMIGWKHVIYDDVMKTDDGIIIHIHDKRITSKCPCCGKRSSHVHSYYYRTMTTLSLHGQRVKIVAETRRYKCENPKCNRKTFASQIDGVTERYSRMTLEARHYLEGLLVHVPATVGSIQSTMSGMPISASTALRMIYGINPKIDYSSIRRICIDDFAFRKGQRYRTMIVDADTGLPVEVVCSRDERDVTKALEKYKKANIISRDRAGAYYKAIRKARPHAKQVADRFHLVMNCGDHMEKALKHNIQTIKQEISKYTNSPPVSQAESLYAPPSLEETERFNKVKALRARGWSYDRIAGEVNSSRRAVTEICNSEIPHGRKVTTPKMILPYIDIIENSIENGLSYTDIRKSILDHGGNISIKALSLGMKKMYPQYKLHRGRYAKGCTRKGLININEGRQLRLLTSGRMHIYLANPDYGIDKKTGECSEEHTLAEKLIASSTTLLHLRDFNIRFRNILKGNSSEDLYKWIERYSKSPYGDVVSFVKSVQRDISPIKNAIKYSISNGLIEGLNNKMKYIKRSMYGRASDRLLWIKIFQTCLT